MDTAYALLIIIQGLTGIIVLLVGWVVKEIRNDGKETLRQVTKLNGRVWQIEGWKESHTLEDKHAHEEIIRLRDALDRKLDNQ